MAYRIASASPKPEAPPVMNTRFELGSGRTDDREEADGGDDERGAEEDEAMAIERHRSGGPRPLVARAARMRGAPGEFVGRNRRNERDFQGTSLAWVGA